MRISELLVRWLASAANWGGLALASLVLVLKGLGWLNLLVWPMALAGYAVGFALGGMWFGWPWQPEDDWEALEFRDEGDAREAMERALYGVRRLTEHNPGGRIPSPLRARVLALCQALEDLLAQWERSRGTLSLQDSFHARHIAIRYLPEALNTYLAIPAAYASTKVLDNGQTAQDIFSNTLAALEAEVRSLGEDLAAQDAQAFLVHSEFLKQKFSPSTEIAALKIPQPGPVKLR